jgi:Protein of unknown function (DUF3025)
MSVKSWKSDFLKASPLFEPLRTIDVCSRLEKLSNWPDFKELANLTGSSSRKIVTRSGKPVRFVPQKKSVCKFEAQYEARIYLTGEVQTRLKNWHDLFNALVWITFPNTKAGLNQLHYQALSQEWRAGNKQRGPLRDAATCFDESGVVVVCSDNNLIKLLKNFEWKALFWTQRAALVECMKFFIFGHGLYEKALNPYTGMTGKGIVLSVAGDFFSQTLSVQLDAIDIMLVDFMRQHLATTADLTPVPVLGYPGWSSSNADETYYDNRHYFRPRPVQR